MVRQRDADEFNHPNDDGDQVELGMNVKVLQERLGNAGVDTAMRFYVHTRAEHHR